MMTQVNTEGRDMVNIILKTNAVKKNGWPLTLKPETKDKKGKKEEV